MQSNGFLFWTLCCQPFSLINTGFSSQGWSVTTVNWFCSLKIRCTSQPLYKMLEQIGETHKYSALQARWHPSKQQPPNYTGNGWEYERATQSPGHREMIASTRSISRNSGEVTAATCCDIWSNACHSLLFKVEVLKHHVKCINGYKICSANKFRALSVKARWTRGTHKNIGQVNSCDSAGSRAACFI